mmetsp:Transcript_2986/g.5056  ORF Transcript_2986/g.5056 Transcript_2986/m.5056 type:complete len:103 (+) Transcript_2986:1039-1347(+)
MQQLPEVEIELENYAGNESSQIDSGTNRNGHSSQKKRQIKSSSKYKMQEYEEMENDEEDESRRNSDEKNHAKPVNNSDVVLKMDAEDNNSEGSGRGHDVEEI